MRTVNVLEAKTNLSRLIDAVESGAEEEIIIARNGKPAVRIVPLAKRKPVVLGIARGQFDPAEIEAMFSPETEAEVMALFEDSANREPDLMDEAVLLDPKKLKRPE